jgi:hypothetical protein
MNGLKKYAIVFAILPIFLFGWVGLAEAALTTPQVNAIVSLLRAFGIDQNTLNNVNAILTGNVTSTAPTPIPIISPTLLTPPPQLIITEGNVVITKSIHSPSSFELFRGATEQRVFQVRISNNLKEAITVQGVRVNVNGATSGDFSKAEWFKSLSNKSLGSGSLGSNISLVDDVCPLTSGECSSGVTIPANSAREIYLKVNVSSGAKGTNDTLTFGISSSADITIKDGSNISGLPIRSASLLLPAKDDAPVDGTINISNSSSTIMPSIPAGTLGILGAFEVDVTKETVLVKKMLFNVELSGEGANDDIDDITGIGLYDSTGALLLGPVNGLADDSGETAGAKDGSFVFNQTITMSVGKKTYLIKGTPGNDLESPSGISIGIFITPSDWDVVSGNTNKTITASPGYTIGLTKVFIADPVSASADRSENRSQLARVFDALKSILNRILK